jgi:hypothetical protein
MSDDNIPRHQNGETRDAGSSNDFGQSAQSGRTAVASLTLTRDSWAVSHNQKVQYTVGSSSLTLEPSKITITSPTITNNASSRFETIGATYLGVDMSVDGGAKVQTVNGLAKQTYAKVT